MRWLRLSLWWSGAAAAALLASGCASVRQTDPPRTATEELLISTAADRAAAQVKFELPKGSRVFVDAQYLDLDNVVYPKYTIASIRDQVIRQGLKLAADRKDADAILELRSGAQSINDSYDLVGIPNFSIPLPLLGQLTIPEIAFFKYHRQSGIAKMAVAVYAPDGSLLYSSGPQYGGSKQLRWSLLFLIHYTSDDTLPDEME